MFPLFIILMISMSDFNNNSFFDYNYEMIHMVFQDDGKFPNSTLPVIIYRNAIDFTAGKDAAAVEKVFRENNWVNSWRNGVFSYHHYHSTAHEVLGVYSGKATVELGGEQGASFEISKGDVVIIPAGVAHKNLESSPDFKVVGAYPKGQSWDMNYGNDGERPAADDNLKKVPLPENDPVFGAEGGLHKLWQK